MPVGSTPIDLAYRINNKLGNNIKKVIVNDEYVPVDYKLKNNDRVKIITETDCGPKEEWVDKVKTSYAKRKIREYTKEKNVICN